MTIHPSVGYPERMTSTLQVDGGVAEDALEIDEEKMNSAKNYYST